MDGEAIAQLLRRTLREVTVFGCEPYYIKYKPQRYCRVQYWVELLDEEGQNVRIPAHVALYPPRRAEKLAAGQGLLYGNDPHQSERAAYIRELHAIVQLFPVDLALLGLSEAASGLAMTCRLQRELPHRLGGELRGCKVELIRYKAQKRAVLRYRLDGTEVQTVYGKLRKDGGSALARSAEAFTRAGVPTPEMHAWFADLGMVVQAEGTGVRLRDLRHTAEYVKWMPSVAQTLKSVHEADVKGLPRYSQGDEAEELQDTADTIGRLVPHLAATVKNLAGRLSERLIAIDGEVSTTHGSFHDDQVLVGDAGVTLIDVDDATLANPLSDVGHFLSYLSAEGAEEAHDRFLTSYLSTQSGVGGEHLLFEAVSLLRWATQPFRELQPDWPSAVERLVRLAEARLDEHLRRSPRRTHAP